MEKIVEVTKKTFTNEKGENMPYVSIRIEVADKTFSLYPKAEDKKLFNYLIGAELEVNGKA